MFGTFGDRVFLRAYAATLLMWPGFHPLVQTKAWASRDGLLFPLLPLFVVVVRYVRDLTEQSFSPARCCRSLRIIVHVYASARGVLFRLTCANQYISYLNKARSPVWTFCRGHMTPEPHDLFACFCILLLLCCRDKNVSIPRGKQTSKLETKEGMDFLSLKKTFRYLGGKQMSRFGTK